MKMRMKRLVSVLCALALAVGLVPMALAADTGYVHNFTTDGKASSVYTITGNLATGKGTVNYNGLTLTQCLKMESSTNVKFNAPTKGTLTLVFVEQAGTAKVDGTKKTAANGIITVDLDAGEHTVTKADKANLFYISFASSAPAHTEHDWSKYEVTKEATCTEAGEETRHCQIAGCTATESRPTEAKGHDFADNGICRRCNWDENQGKFHVHDWGDDDKCIVCGAEKPTANFTKVGGHFETAYAQWSFLTGVDQYKVYVKKAADSDYQQLDDELIRRYPTYMRVDAVGLAAGDYQLKVVGLLNGVPQATMVTGTIHVLPHDRTGFAHKNGTASGAYNEDGTLRDGAEVIYVSEQTKDTVTLGGSTGIQNILTDLPKNRTKPLCVRFIGDVTDPATLEKGDLLVDKWQCGLTLEGIGNDAVANGWGIRIKGSSNVEVRNLGFMNCDSGEGDCLGLQQANEHIWAHNNDFFYGDAGSDADQAKGDGSLDTKKSTMVTHSYNHFWDSGKCNLQGMKDETTDNYITYHHNWYDHSDSRHPRIRTCTVHIYNNYFDGNAKYGVGMTMGGSAFVENNYFRNVSKPMMISMQGTDAAGEGTFSGENGGVIKSFHNTMVMENRTLTYKTHKDSATDFDAYEAESRDESVPGTYKAKQGGTTYNNFDTNAGLMYACTPDTPEGAMAKVQAAAGRVEGGDFCWIFDNATDDTDYSVNAALKSALVNYKGTLVAVGGTVPVIDGGGSTTPDPCVHHDWRWTITKPATCIAAGEKVASCFKCGALNPQTETIPATGHTFVNGVCANCGGTQGSVPDPGPTPGGDTTTTYTLTGDEVFGKLTSNASDKNGKPIYNCEAYQVLDKQGTAGFFTIYTGAVGTSGGTKIDYSKKTIGGESFLYRVNFGGKAKAKDPQNENKPSDVIGFTTEGSATVKIWWVQGGGDPDKTETDDPKREMAILDETGTQVAVTTKGADAAKNAVVAVETLTLAKAGTYYLGGTPNKNNIFKVEVAVPKAEEVEPDVDHSGWLKNPERDLKWYYKEDQVLTVEEMTADDTVLAARYDANGRFLGVARITPEDNTAEIDNATPKVKLFWVEAQKPMCEATVAWGGEE